MFGVGSKGSQATVPAPTFLLFRRKMIKTSALWKSSVKVAQQEIAVQAEQAAETDEPHADDLKPVPPAGSLHARARTPLLYVRASLHR